MNDINLSEKQKEIVEYKNSPICVEASAGSGKTRVLTQRIKFLLDQTKKKVLALTFTNKAGEEIKERLAEDIDINNRLFVGTFHGFCQYVLENHGSSIGFSKMPHIFEDDKDRLELIGQAIEQVPTYYSIYKEQSIKDKNNFKYRALNFISKVKRELITDSQYHEHTEDDNIILLYRSYQELLRRQNAIDFDDLLLETYRLFIDYPHIASLYRRSYFGICIDEAQDLNHAQYNLLLALCGNEHKNIMLVGDPKQSIYHFNGSSSKFMLKNFIDDFEAKKYELNENFRSSKEVIKASNKIISLSDDKVLTNTPYNGKFKIKACPTEEEEAQCVIDEIKKLIAIKTHDEIEGQISLEKMVVLARNKYVFKNLESKLKSENIPYHYKMTPGAIKFESDVMKIFNLKLKLKLNPQDILHKEQLDDMNIKNNEFASKIDILLKDLKDDGSNLIKLFDGFIEELKIIDNIDKVNMIRNDISELKNHWLKYAKNSNNRSLLQFKNAMALGQTYTDTEEIGLTLSTVHTMKGQEFDIVFLIGMDEGTFPDYRAIQKGGIELDQEKNNLYVAFTRAKRFLYVTYPEKRTMPWGGIKHRKISSLLENFSDKQ